MILTSDITTSLILSKENLKFINLFEEVNILTESIKNSEHGLSNGLYEGTDIFKIIDNDTITIKEYETYEHDKMELITIKSDIINYNGADINPKVFDLMSANWCWIQA